ADVALGGIDAAAHHGVVDLLDRGGGAGLDDAQPTRRGGEALGRLAAAAPEPARAPPPLAPRPLRRSEEELRGWARQRRRRGHALPMGDPDLSAVPQLVGQVAVDAFE